MQDLSFVKKSDIKTARNILIRVDFVNYHLFSAYFSDFLQALIKEGKKIVIAGTFGGKQISFRSMQKKLAKESGLKVKFVKENILEDGEKIQKKLVNLQAKELILLENLDFYPEEFSLSLKFATALGALADLYIIDSFSLFGASTSSIALLPLQIKTVYSDSVKFYSQELTKLYKNLFPHKSTLLLGGEVDILRVNSLNKVIARFDYILLGTNWASYFLKAKNQAGRPSKIRESLMSWLKKNRSKIIFPLDLLVVRKSKGDYKMELLKPNELLNTDIVIDLGPETIRYYALLLRSSQEIVYDQLLSPVGDANWQHSDLILSRAMANRSRGKAYGLILGQDLLEIFEKEGLLAMLDLLIDDPAAFYRFMNIKK